VRYPSQFSGQARVETSTCYVALDKNQ
jgi:hypothetical protein